LLRPGLFARPPGAEQLKVSNYLTEIVQISR
jgi:hypothetical protein